MIDFNDLHGSNLYLEVALIALPFELNLLGSNHELFFLGSCCLSAAVTARTTELLHLKVRFEYSTLLSHSVACFLTAPFSCPRPKGGETAVELS